MPRHAATSLLVLFVLLAPFLGGVSFARAAATIGTVAGGGSGGDGSQATAARLLSPCAVAVDGAGNLYIADADDNRVRKVSPAGIITTLAGNGSYGFSGDGGAATAAALAAPQSVAVDAAGNVYIADSDNNRIRRVAAATGVIATVAGSGSYGYLGDGLPATAAALGRPLGVAVDSAGNIYIADTDNQVVRKVGGGGVIGTVAGNHEFGYSGDGGPATGASFIYPSGIAVDLAGNIFVTDTYNLAVRKIVAAGGTVVTVAGPDAAGGPYGATGVAVDAAGNLHVAERDGNQVSRFDAATGTLSAVAGTGFPGYGGDAGSASSAFLYAPTGVAVDAGGNVYVADAGNGRVRKISFPAPVQVTFVAGPNGSIGGSAVQTVPYGGSTSAVTALPDAGYRLVNWTDPGGAELGTGNPFALTGVVAPVTVRANFAPERPALQVTVSGAGSGSVHSSPAGIACDVGTCSAAFAYGTSVTLTATPAAGSAFGGWTGACIGSGACSPSMTAPLAVGASFVIVPNVRIAGNPAPFGLLQPAYAAASSGATLLARDAVLSESPWFGTRKEVTLKGGYDAAFLGRAGFTVIDGAMRIGSGRVTVDRVKVR